LNGYSAERTALLARNLTERFSALPGVRSVSAAELPTLADDHWGGNVVVEGSNPGDAASEHVRRNAIGPDYFATLGIPLLSGREVSWQDDAAAPRVAVINETMARRFFAGRSPLGARLAFSGGNLRPDVAIVGVVRDSKAGNVGEMDGPFVYTPYLQDPKLGALTFYLRSQANPESLAGSIRSEVRRLDGDLPIFDLKTLRGQIDESLVTQRLLVFLSAAFGGLAALLAALGIYGVLAFSVEQRRQEIGVRMALGAGPATVRGLILSEVFRFLLLGAVIGLPAAYALGRAVESLLYGVHASDARIFGVAAALMALVSLAAAWPPARRAARTNPMEALRNE
jgi:predicted permease